MKEILCKELGVLLQHLNITSMVCASCGKCGVEIRVFSYNRLGVSYACTGSAIKIVLVTLAEKKQQTPTILKKS